MLHATAEDGVKLYYEEAGAGAPILFVHEYAGDWRSWEPQMRFFARRHRCITYSFRGYPRSDVPESGAGARFICDRAAVQAVSKWLTANGWTVVTSELGYVPKHFPELTESQRTEVGEFLQALEEHDDVHRVWAAVK